MSPALVWDFYFFFVVADLRLDHQGFILTVVIWEDTRHPLIDMCLDANSSPCGVKVAAGNNDPKNLFPPAMIFSLTASRWWRHFAVFTDGWKCGGTPLLPLSLCHFLSSLSLCLPLVAIPSPPPFFPSFCPPPAEITVYSLLHMHISIIMVALLS